MTDEEIKNNLLDLDRDIVMFDGPSWYTPYKVAILGKDWGKQAGKIMID